MFSDQMRTYTGHDSIEPPLEFPVSDTVTAEFGSWSEVAQICGESRVWGGMHFAVSVHMFALVGVGLSTFSGQDYEDVVDVCDVQIRLYYLK